jgi:hypothetical protein
VEDAQPRPVRERLEHQIRGGSGHIFAWPIIVVLILDERGRHVVGHAL